MSKLADLTPCLTLLKKSLTGLLRGNTILYVYTYLLPDWAMPFGRRSFT